MKTLNLNYEINSSEWIKGELENISEMTTNNICKTYSIDPDDVKWFVGLMKEDYETLLAKENRYYINDRKEEYAQLYNFL